jgi:ribosome-binding protein aMBF1 (putative translation factor)
MNGQTQNPTQIKLAILHDKGWTLAALADELGLTVNALEKWKAGQRNPANEKAVIEMLENIEKRRRIPKQRRYARGSRAKPQKDK